MIGLFTGDWHVGLSVEDLDRTPDVMKAVEFIVDEAIRRKVDFVSIGGDLTDNNTPLPDHLALLISVLNRLEEAEIVTFVTKGNHCAISAPGRKWGLTPLEKVGYQNVHFITEPKSIKFGGHTFVFLPHTTRSQAIEAGFKSAQEFIDAKAEELIEKAKDKVTVISHYNVNGCKIGTEALTLRQTDLQLPSICLRSPKVLKVVNSHIHTAQMDKKIVMPGSPVCTDFGDLETAKGFFIGKLSDSGWKFEQVLTPQSPMQEIELNFVGMTPKQMLDEVKSLKTTVLEDSIVKVRMFIEEENVALIDFDKIRSDLAGRVRYVKSFDRIITRRRQVRDKNQKSTMRPQEAVKNYLDFRKPQRADRKLHLAMRILSEENLSVKRSDPVMNETSVSDMFDESLDKLDEEFDFSPDLEERPLEL